MITALLSALALIGCNDTAVSIYNTAPTATITDPADGSIYAPDELVELRGLVQDGQQSAEELSVIWTSSIDGELGAPQADVDGIVSLPVTGFTGGSHAVTLTVTDEEGKQGSQTITIEVGYTDDGDAEGTPTLTVIGPIEGELYTYSEPVTVVATATDEEQPWETLNASIISSRDGSLWTGTPASNGAITESFSGLTIGVHEFTVTVEDADGHVVSDTVSVEIVEDGEPEVSILEPASASSWWTTDTITFEGLVVDDVTDPLDMLVEWESDLDGPLHLGNPDSSGLTLFGTTLSEGLHVITLTATDTDGNVSAASTTVTAVDAFNYDNDGDGYSEAEADCDDTDDTTYTGASEVCDDYDNNCNGLINEDWWDNYDIGTGFDNNTFATAYNLGEVDSSWLWNGDYLEVAGLTMHEEVDEDWFRFDVDDDWYDNASFSVKILNLYAGPTWVVELYRVDGSSMTLEDSASGSGSLTINFDGDWLDEDEDQFAVRVYTNSWAGSGICSTVYTLQINA